MSKEDIWMKLIALGKAGTTYTHQGDFPEKILCTFCKPAQLANLAFVYHENDNAKDICELYDNKPGECWPHDSCSIAVYICKTCGEATVEWNQA